MSDIERDDRRDDRAASYDREGSRGVGGRVDKRDDYDRSAPREERGYHREPRYDAGPGPPRRPPHAPTPDPSRVLGVFGLSMDTTERDLEAEFGRLGPVEKVIIVYDKQTQRSRGFGFVTMENLEDATRGINDLNGFELQGRRLRVDYSATTRPHDPTPGAYRGLKREDNYRSGPPPPPAREYNDRWAALSPSGAGRRDDRYSAPAPVRDDRWGATSSRDSRRDDRYASGDRYAPREDRYSSSYSRGGGDYDRRDDRDSRDPPRESRARSRSPPRRRDDYPAEAEAPVADRY